MIISHIPRLQRPILADQADLVVGIDRAKAWERRYAGVHALNKKALGILLIYWLKTNYSLSIIETPSLFLKRVLRVRRTGIRLLLSAPEAIKYGLSPSSIIGISRLFGIMSSFLMITLLGGDFTPFKIFKHNTMEDVN